MRQITIPVKFESIWDIARCGLDSVQVPVAPGTYLGRKLIEKVGERMRAKSFDHILLKSAKNSRLSFSPKMTQLVFVDGVYLINFYVGEVVSTKIREEYVDVDDTDYMAVYNRKKSLMARS